MGTVHDAGTEIVREAAPRHREAALDAYRMYERHGLSRFGVVETALEPPGPDGVVRFRHRKHLITYPHEWPAALLKAAALLHLDLFVELDRFGYTLKDALPANVLFDFQVPVFVDFFSLVPTVALAHEAWLGAPDGEDARFTVLGRMFFPQIVVPLLVHARGAHRQARSLLLDRACNVSTNAPSWRDLLPGGRREFAGALHGLGTAAKYASIAHSGKRGSFTETCRRLRALVESIEVRPATGSYGSYYRDKGEDFPLDAPQTWRDKQRTVDALLQRLSPAQVLDLGANTGWFSRLAARRGAAVVATDVDEKAADLLLRRAADEQLPILPLILPFGGLTTARRGLTCLEADSPGHPNADRPLLLPATERLRSDLVLCLALAHHLVLGEGRAVEDIFAVLSSLAAKALVVEYIDRKDPLISAEPEFFPKIQAANRDRYDLSLMLEAGKRRFAEAVVLDSHPATRKLLVFTGPRRN